MRACRDLGMGAVAVYSDADRDALHVRLADERSRSVPPRHEESYLSIEKLIAIARRSGCDAVHPGYGFLSENADFAEAVTAAGIAFIGPPAKVQRLLGEKTQARRLAKEAGVPIAEGANELLRDIGEARAVAARVGYPVMLKAAGGGGGKGMRIVRSAGELEAAWRVATGEASAAFGTPALFLERLIEGARHIEMQLIADQHGNVVWLGERDCSLQRRHQKLIEESPGPSVDDTLRAKLGDAAVRIARSAGYVNAGTAEFLVSPSGEFFFLEVNTRLQVEHPVTGWSRASTLSPSSSASQRGRSCRSPRVRSIASEARSSSASPRKMRVRVRTLDRAYRAPSSSSRPWRACRPCVVRRHDRADPVRPAPREDRCVGKTSG